MSPRLICPFLLALLAVFDVAAADDVIRISPEQALRSGVTAIALSELRAVGGIRLPAQVTVPPTQVEVVASPLPSLVVALRAAYGETVRKGQILARLQGMQLVELQRDFANAQAQAGLAQESLRRDEELHADGIISQSRLSATRAAERQAAVQLAEKRQALRLAGAAEPNGAVPILSGQVDIRAPFDAVVLEAGVQPGSRVDGMTPLFRLGRLEPLWLEIQATPGQAAGVAIGDTVGIPGCARGGHVALVAPHMQAASQSLLIRAELPYPGGCVRPFQYVQVEIVSARRPDDKTWRLPASMLVRHRGMAWLFVEVPGGFRPLAVTVLDEGASFVTLTADLTGDTRIAAKSVSTLKAIWLGLGGGR